MRKLKLGHLTAQVLDELHKLGFTNRTIGHDNIRKILNEPIPGTHGIASKKSAFIERVHNTTPQSHSAVDLIQVEPEECIILREFEPMPTPGYLNLLHRNSHRIPTLMHCLEELCNFLEDNSIQLIQAKSAAICNLCDFAVSSQIKRKHLIACFCSREELDRVLRIPGKRYKGINAVQNAATKLSATYRMHLVRKKYQQYWDHFAVNQVINKYWKIKQRRKNTHAEYQAWFKENVLVDAEYRMNEYLNGTYKKKLIILYEENAATFNVGSLNLIKDSTVQYIIITDQESTSLLQKITVFLGYVSPDQVKNYLRRITILCLDKEYINAKISFSLKLSCSRNLKKTINEKLKVFRIDTLIYIACKIRDNNIIEFAHSISVCIIGGIKINDIKNASSSLPVSSTIIEISSISIRTLCTYQSIDGIILVAHPSSPEIDTLIEQIKRQKVFGTISIHTSPDGAKVEHALTQTDLYVLSCVMVSGCLFTTRLLFSNNELPFQTRFFDKIPYLDRNQSLKAYEKYRVGGEDRILLIFEVQHSQYCGDNAIGILNTIQNRLQFDNHNRTGVLMPPWNYNMKKQIPILCIHENSKAIANLMLQVIKGIDEVVTVNHLPFHHNIQEIYDLCTNRINETKKPLVLKTFQELVVEEKEKKIERISVLVQSLARTKLTSEIFAEVEGDFKSFQIISTEYTIKNERISSRLLAKLKSIEDAVPIPEELKRQLELSRLLKKISEDDGGPENEVRRELNAITENTSNFSDMADITYASGKELLDSKISFNEDELTRKKELKAFIRERLKEMREEEEKSGNVILGSNDEHEMDEIVVNDKLPINDSKTITPPVEKPAEEVLSAFRHVIEFLIKK